jgi:hypothetical protein
MPNFMGLPKRVAAKPASEVPVPVQVAAVPVVQPAKPPAPVVEAPPRERRIGEPPRPGEPPRSAMYPSFSKLPAKTMSEIK